jgi:MoxR-like ATPase
MSMAASDLAKQIEAHMPVLTRLQEEVGKVVVGQRYMIDRLLLALIAEGHILVEGLPGLAKTTAIKAVADAVHTGFARIQFTPDLLPADLIGTEVYRPQSGSFEIKKGPVFTNLLLADEINRAPAKVQSALLEAMQERQVTLGGETYVLPSPFLVLATQNPIDQEGTYPLPEAQMDRFMLKLRVGYPDKAQEKDILRRMAQHHTPQIQSVLTPQDILTAQQLSNAVYVDAKVEDYIVNIVFATRSPSLHQLAHLEPLITYGASPRASIFLVKAARVHACMAGRGYVTPQDVKTIAPDVLRHRIGLSYEAEARDMTADDIVADILTHVDVP